MSKLIGRRRFIGLSANAALICGGGHALDGLTKRDVERSDLAASRLPHPQGINFVKGHSASFPTPTPAPGGRAVEYWIQAVSHDWDIAPLRTEQWMHMKIRGKRVFRAFMYQLCTAGFGTTIGPPSMPGPILHAEVGDTVVVHFRNADHHYDQAVTMHTHGLRYNPEYDGAYMGDYTRTGGFIAPGEEFTYTWEATPDSVGAWPYHDHGPNHTINTLRGLFGACIVRPKGAPVPTREYVLYLHSLPPQITGRDGIAQCINGRVGAGNTPTLRAKVGDDVAIHAIGGDQNFHTFHMHGHRWEDSAGKPIDCPTVGPNERQTVRFREDNPGRWLYHCHVSTHQDAGMAGWYLVDF